MQPIVALSSEEYSDYGIHGYFLVPSAEYVKAKLAEWRAAHPEQEERYRARYNDFIEWFKAQPEVTAFDGITEIWLGAYNNWKTDG